jgi:hypothetical protein
MIRVIWLLPVAALLALPEHGFAQTHGLKAPAGFEGDCGLKSLGTK